MKNIYKFLVESLSTGKIEKDAAVQMITMLKEEENKQVGDIAVIGMAGQFPLADTLDEYWEMIENGMEAVRQFPAVRKQDTDNYLRTQGHDVAAATYAEASYLERIDLFDNQFFRISPKEASMMDPSQRIFMETVWQAIEDAGYGGPQIVGTNTGVYVGYSNNIKDSYLKTIFDTTDLDASSIVGNLTAIIPGRIAYHLDLKGPTMVVDTACSSSLVSIALACQALRTHQCEMAVAGGIRISTVPLNKENEQLGIESTDGKTRAFDHHSDGAGVGEGVAAVLLKPLQQALQDGDHVYAVIKGVAVNQDGSSISMTAPNPNAHTELIVKAWEDAQIDPETIAYIETHGTGTNLGDPIEIKGIQNAFRQYTDKQQFCAVSSVKTNIGHLFEAAGIANFIKAVLALQHKKIPASLHFNNPNRTIDFLQSPVYVNTSMREWETDGHPRRCGVSSFGISGTNAHLVLEEAPVRAAEPVHTAEPHVLALSAKTRPALDALVRRYAEWFAGRGATSVLRDVCYTANAGRGHYGHRVTFVAENAEAMRTQLVAWSQADEQASAGRYGYHKLVAHNRDTTEAFEKTEADLHALTAQAEELLQAGGSLTALCDLYLAGADVDWAQLYSAANVQRVRLPVYPFERHRHWLDLQVAEEQDERVEMQDLYYTMNWVPLDLASEAATESQTGTMLLFLDGGETGVQLADAYRAQGRRVVTVQLGEQYARLADDAFVIGWQEQDYHQLFHEIRDYGLTQVLHLFSRTGAQRVGSLDDLRTTQRLGMYSLYYLTRALLQNNASDAVELVLLSDYAHEVTGDEQVLKPENASLYGLGKVVALEYPNLQCRAIDLDEQTDVTTLLREIATPSGIYQVAYRNGQRYVEQFGEIEIDQVADQPLELRTDGVYVLTGGAGGIGLEIAKHLAAQQQGVQLAFINRTPLPMREEWDAILAADTDRKLVHKLRFIREIEALGAHVSAHVADVSSESQMEHVLANLRTTYGRINGVLHVAGIPGDGYLIRKEQAVFDEVIGPKIWGAYLLDQLTAHDPLDFFAIFSSGISMIGEVGQGDYVAANAYLDAYAAYRNKQGRRTVTFDWTSWKTAGMSVEYGFNVDLIFKSILTEQALHGFDTCLRKDVSRVLVGELNQQSEYMLLLKASPFLLSPKITRLLEQYEATRTTPAAKPSHESKRAGNRGEVKLVGKDGAAYTEVEKVVARVYRDTLGFDEINIHDSFFELGGDSVMLNSMHAVLEKEFPGKVKVADLFAHTSIAKLAQFIGHEVPTAKRRPAEATAPSASADDDIAIIGLALKMPMADDADQFWMNLVNGVDCIQPFPAHRAKDITDYLIYADGERPEDIKFANGAYLNDSEQFDYKFFKLTPKEAQLTDPHQRLFMQTVWHAIEEAGYGGGRLAGTNTGVYVGFAGSFKDSYQRLIKDMEPESLVMSAVGNITAMIPTRICYQLDLKGPAMVIDTACSSTLVAIHSACRDLRNGDASMAIVAGVRSVLMPLDRENMKIGIEASTGQTYSFDRHADGSGYGEGSAAVLLKPLRQALADNDQIHAVIKGSAINQDGLSMGITAPNPAAQETVILQAWENAQIDPESLSFIEAHGTATPLGDPIEIDGLERAFRQYTDQTQFCAIGSVKSNVGHLFEAAGITSLVKSVLALKNRVVPPSVHFHQPNPKIDFASSPVYVNTTARPWAGEGPMRGAISSFGFSGTNAHVVLEEAPPVARNKQHQPGVQVFTLTAKSDYSFRTLLDRYRQFAATTDVALTDLCYTANTGRDHFAQRLAVIVPAGETLADQLATLDVDNLSANAFYGTHRITTERKEGREAGALTEGERQALTAQAAELLDSFLASGQRNMETLTALCTLYVQGADIDWQALYADRDVRKVSLPLYPFDTSRCWIDVPEGRRLFAAPLEQEAPDQFFTSTWQPAPLAADAPPSATTGPVLLLADGRGLGTALAAKYRTAGRTVIEVALGVTYAKQDDEHFVISGSAEDCDRLLADLQGVAFDKVLHLLAMRETVGVTTLAELEQSQQVGVYSLFHFTRALARAGIDREMEVVLLAENVCAVSGSEANIQPEHSSLFGFGKVILKEHPNVLCRSIDLDEHVTADLLWPELEATSETYQVAYRNGQRYIEVFAEIDLPQAADRPLVLHENGVYLITGGAGGIGLEVARYLAAQKPIQLMLLNRTRMPDRSEWDAILAADQDQATIKKIRNIQSIEALGATVVCYSVDVANRDALAAVLSDIRTRYGKIAGIVHGAGVGGAESIVNRKLEDFHAVFNPKVQGTWNLDDLTRVDQPDFMVLFSSIATLFTMAGQGDYIAANAYLDSYAAYRNQLGLRTMTVNWSTWRETGMSVSHNFNIDTLFKAIMTQEAIDGLHAFLNKDVPNALIGEINYDSKIIFLLEKSNFRLSDKITRDLARRTSGTRKAKKAASTSGEVVLTGSESGEYAETELRIARICKTMLGFDEINIFDNFFELGADSIVLTRMHGMIDQEFPGVVAVTDIFEYTSIYRLAQHINDQQTGQGAAAAKQQEPDLEDALRTLFDDLENSSISLEEALDNLKDL